MFRIVVDQIQTPEPEYWLGYFRTCVCLDHVVWKKHGGGRFCCDFDEFLYACSVSRRCLQFAQFFYFFFKRHVLFPPGHVFNRCTKRCVVKLKRVWNWVMKDDWTIDWRRCRRLTFEIKSFCHIREVGGGGEGGGFHSWQERKIMNGEGAGNTVWSPFSQPTFSPLSCCHCPVVLVEGFSSSKCRSLECPGVNRSLVFHHIPSSPLLGSPCLDKCWSR